MSHKFVVADSEGWLRSKKKSKAGDWIIILSGSSKNGFCWIRQDVPTPTFDGPFPVRRMGHAWALTNVEASDNKEDNR